LASFNHYSYTSSSTFAMLLRFLVMRGALAAGCLLSSVAQAQETGPPALNDCEAPAIRGYVGFPPQISPFPSWQAARFNPADQRQIAALRNELDSAGRAHRHLYLLNTATQQQRLLLRDVGCGLSWSSRGWLALERRGQLWKMKANGDSLTQLTPSQPSSQLPVWSPSGQQLACWREHGASPAAGPTLVVLDAAGRLVQELPASSLVGISAPVWSPDGRKLLFVGRLQAEAFQLGGIRETELATGITRTVLEFYPTMPHNERYNLCWLKPGRQLLWRTSELFVVDLARQQQQMVWQKGDLLSLDASPKTQHVLLVGLPGDAEPDDHRPHPWPTSPERTQLVLAKPNGAGAKLVP
jgi:dipeptidyl aminopeptidase/acylaminoacyl peptidase